MFNPSRTSSQILATRPWCSCFTVTRKTFNRWLLLKNCEWFNLSISSMLKKICWNWISQHESKLALSQETPTLADQGWYDASPTRKCRFWARLLHIFRSKNLVTRSGKAGDIPCPRTGITILMWSKREFVLTYSDLETSSSSGPPGPLSWKSRSEDFCPFRGTNPGRIQSFLWYFLYLITSAPFTNRVMESISCIHSFVCRHVWQYLLCGFVLILQLLQRFGNKVARLSHLFESCLA